LGRRVIQTDLPYDEYVQLKKLVEKKRITMDVGVREAIRQNGSSPIYSSPKIHFSRLSQLRRE
jgi:hypothetical protein